MLYHAKNVDCRNLKPANISTPKPNLPPWSCLEVEGCIKKKTVFLVLLLITPDIPSAVSCEELRSPWCRRGKTKAPCISEECILEGTLYITTGGILASFPALRLNANE